MQDYNGIEFSAVIIKKQLFKRQINNEYLWEKKHDFILANFDVHIQFETEAIVMLVAMSVN